MESIGITERVIVDIQLHTGLKIINIDELFSTMQSTNSDLITAMLT